MQLILIQKTEETASSSPALSSLFSDVVSRSAAMFFRCDWRSANLSASAAISSRRRSRVIHCWSSLATHTWTRRVSSADLILWSEGAARTDAKHLVTFPITSLLVLGDTSSEPTAESPTDSTSEDGVRRATGRIAAPLGVETAALSRPHRREGFVTRPVDRPRGRPDTTEPPPAGGGSNRARSVSRPWRIPPARRVIAHAGGGGGSSVPRAEAQPRPGKVGTP